MSLLEKHFLVAANTFFEVGPTFYGPPPRRHATRVDYICVPASCLRTVARCHVQYKAADRLQIICDSARRDHVPIQMEISLRLEYVGSAKKVEQQWDHETLTRDALSGRRRHILLNAVETKLAEQVGEVGAAQVDSPDRLWKHFATAIREAVSETYPPQARQTKSRPRETQDAVEAMLCSRALLVSYRPLVLGKGHFNLDGVHTPCLHQALHDLLHVWRLSANYRRARKQMDICTKRDAKEKQDHILQDFQRAWQQRDLHQVWRLSRTLSGKRIGPKRRRYDAAKKVNPSQHEWMAFLEVAMPMKSTGTTLLAMLRTTRQYTLITGRQEGVLSKICMDCVRVHNMLLLGKCALLGESQRRFGDSSCSLNGKSTVCVVEWVSVPLRHHLYSSTEFCYTCSLPSACSIACLMNGNVVTQLAWTNTMVRRARLDCVLSTTWKYWVNGIVPLCGGGVVQILRGTTPQDISVENLALRLCCSNVCFRAGCEDIVCLMVFHCWMCLMPSPVLHERVYGWLCPTLLSHMMQHCCNNAMNKLTCVFLPEMQTCVFNLGRVPCKEIQLHVHCSWKYITHHWTTGCEKLSNLNSWLWILFLVVWWTFQFQAMRMTWRGALFLKPVRSYICACVIPMKYWTKNCWRLAYNKIQRSRSTLFFCWFGFSQVPCRCVQRWAASRKSMR